MLCILVEFYRRFRGIYRLNLQCQKVYRAGKQCPANLKMEAAYISGTLEYFHIKRRHIQKIQHFTVTIRGTWNLAMLQLFPDPTCNVSHDKPTSKANWKLYVSISVHILKCRWEDNFKMNLKGGWECVDWIDEAQHRDQWRALVNRAVTFRVPQNAGNMGGWANIGFSRTQLH
jgi:hypothetical protein